MTLQTRTRRVVTLFPNRVRGFNNKAIQNLAQNPTNPTIIAIIGPPGPQGPAFDGVMDLGTFN